MFRRMICFVVVLALASASYGVGYQGDECHPGHMLLGNWEMLMSGQWNTGGFDGWVINGINTMIGHTDTGATLDSHALKVVVSGGWQKTIELKLQDPSRYAPDLNLVDAFFANDTLQVDITRIASNWAVDIFAAEGDIWAQFGLVINSGGGPATGWLDQGSWDAPALSEGDVTTTMSWNYGELRDQMDQSQVQYLEFCFISNTGAGYIGDATWYIDHAVLIPEPATIALLGLGGLALLRRKQ